jgi:hypothetical protein
MQHLLEIQGLKTQLSEAEAAAQDYEGRLEMAELRLADLEKSLSLEQSRGARDREALLEKQEDIIRSHEEAMRNAARQEEMLRQ